MNMRDDDTGVSPAIPEAGPQSWISAPLARVLREFMPAASDEDDGPHRHDGCCGCQMRGE